ncbi:MAG: endonuclease/exonuclease/phosphatase family protein [Bacteroidota bacterium]|jgi:endonuclease/exonuclease/phosphatase family metal-dependent hydrolase
MNKHLKSLAFILILLLFVSCESESIKTNDKFITIGTFNVSWLGDSENDRIDRSKRDYKRIAEIIQQTGADVFALQEVENADALKLLIKHLPDWSFIVGELGGEQNTAVLYKKSVKVQKVGEYTPLIVEEHRTRPGLIVKIKKRNLDLLMMVVHFKSTSRYDDTEEKLVKSRELRQEQAQVASDWADSMLRKRKNKESDIIIIGDFNDTPQRKHFPTLTPLVENNKLFFLTADVKSCKYPSAYVIDNIIVSKNLYNRYIQNSVRVFDFFSTMPKKETETISDHCPVLVEFDIVQQDND